MRAKKLLPALFLILLILVSCTKRTLHASPQTVQIAVTFYPLYIMCMNIVKDIPTVELVLIAPPNTGCLHDYALTTKDMCAIEQCNILVAHGAGMESFLDKATALKQNATITASEAFPLIDGNPHVWVSVRGARHEVQKIADALAVLDSAHAAQYAANAAAYDAKLFALEQEMYSSLAQYSGSSIVTFHEAFPYFAQEFGFAVASVVEREPGTAPSAKELAELIAQITAVKKLGKKITLYAETQYSSQAADIIAKETGLAVYMLDPCVTGELHEDAYINAQKNNMRTLIESLGASR
ncbi:MAG: zinc ABC transporter substrate-binding protein [Treponema sp.]|nr:zinc ABC transporter substrate-binding protein [Treponema sp.]